VAVNLSEALSIMTKAGPNGIRAIPMAGQNVHTGLYKVEVRRGLKWECVIESVPKSTAENLISQATSRVLLG
jgi:hypothetical protein